MKRLIGGLLVALAVPVLATSIAMGAPSDFTYKSVQVNYDLGADKQGRSTLKVSETLVAEFPTSGNYTIERTLPTAYDGHPTNLQIVSVTDQSGTALNFTASNEAGGKLVKIATSASGERTYVITYTEHDVTRYAPSVPQHEFNWDVTGTKFQQSIGALSMTVTVDANASPTLNKKVTCTQTVNGQAQGCTISEQGSSITANANNVPPSADVAIDVGFAPGTFRAYEGTSWQQFMPVVISVIIIVMLVIFGLSVHHKRRRQ